MKPLPPRWDNPTSGVHLHFTAEQSTLEGDNSFGWAFTVAFVLTMRLQFTTSCTIVTRAQRQDPIHPEYSMTNEVVSSESLTYTVSPGNNYPASQMNLPTGKYWITAQVESSVGSSEALPCYLNIMANGTFQFISMSTYDQMLRDQLFFDDIHATGSLTVLLFAPYSGQLMPNVTVYLISRGGHSLACFTDRNGICTIKRSALVPYDLVSTVFISGFLC
eukprot:TRINITY_DN4774_c0_g1_i1.p1 TRINITY_DN4774_c0_g1~~TRINITY_DN4774_c0_g1_i1.p1  ORF type:complete len:219 (+),score=1.08 TRINITY_DN4774_c0_g1_i1:134-790(+)